MRWRDLQPGDQLNPLEQALRFGLSPCVVLDIVELGGDGPGEVEIVFLDLVHRKSFREKRFASGSAALGYEVVRGGERIV